MVETLIIMYMIIYYARFVNELLFTYGSPTLSVIVSTHLYFRKYITLVAMPKVYINSQFMPN